MQPIGSSLGLLTGAGGTIEFIDQDKGDPKVHQYSVDVQRELPRRHGGHVGYIGATGRDIGYFGTAGGGSTKRSTSTRSIRRSRARRSRGRTAPGTRRRCAQSVPNPFFGVAGAGEFADVARRSRRASCCGRSRSSATSTMYEKTDGGRRQYHAATFVLDKRTDRTGGAAASATP